MTDWKRRWSLVIKRFPCQEWILVEDPSLVGWLCGFAFHVYSLAAVEALPAGTAHVVL